MDLRFPGRDASNPDVVVITGDEDAVLECKEHLLQLEDEFVSCSSITGNCSTPVVVVVVGLIMSPLRRHIFVCFMAKWAFLGGFRP